MKDKDIDKSLEKIFVYGYDWVRLTINSDFKEKLENYFRNNIKYIIDNSDYSCSTNYIKYTLLNEHFNPMFVIHLDRNLKIDEIVYKLICDYEKKYKITELFNNKNYEIKEI